MSRVRVQNLTKKIGNNVILDNLSFVSEESKFTTILGPSGCGKTTILRIIAGLERLNEGEVWIGNRLVSSKESIVPSENREIGMVFQSYALWPHLNVFENVAFPLKIRKIAKDKIKDRVKDALELIKLSGYEKRQIGQLSGGQQQRVALARSLIYNPKLLLLDEPLANLDVKVRESMRFELKELQRKTGVTTLFVTHDQSEAMILSDKIIVMKGGKIIQEGVPYEIYNKPADEFVLNFIGKSNLIPAKILELGDGGLVEAEVNIYCKIPKEFKKGEKVLLCIRPENIHICESSSLKNTWKAKIEKKSFLGHIIEYHVKINGLSIILMEKSNLDFPIGKQIYVRIDENKANVIHFKK